MLHADDLALCLANGLVGVLWFEGLKLLQRQQEAAHPGASADGFSSVSEKKGRLVQ
jgi:hypothetical protein